MCSLVIDWCSFFVNVYTVSSSSRYLDNLIALMSRALKIRGVVDTC